MLGESPCMYYNMYIIMFKAIKNNTHKKQQMSIFSGTFNIRFYIILILNIIILLKMNSKHISTTVQVYPQYIQNIQQIAILTCIIWYNLQN